MSFMFPLYRYTESFYDAALDGCSVITVSFAAKMAHNRIIFLPTIGVDVFPVGFL